MKAKILGFFCSLLLLAASSKGQTFDGVLYTNFNNFYKWRGGAFDSTLLLPQIAASIGKRPGALRYSSADSSIYSWTGTQWRKVGESIDTTSLSNRIDLRVKYSDTAAMLSPYLRSNVAAATYQPIGNYDTATVVKAYVTNAEAVTITKGQVVYIFGAQGDRASVKLAKNTSDTFSSKTLGIVRADIAAGQAGWVTTQGQVNGINLGAYTAGDILWLDSIAGGFTKTKPVAPYHSVFVGVVERANVGNGLIYVKPQNGQELDELHNVKITSPTNNQVLAYTASTGIWENKNVTTALGYTPLDSVLSVAGAGVSLVKGNDQVKRLKAGSGISITNNTDSVTITSTASGGIQWTGVDSLYAYNRAKTGFYDYSEFGGAGGLGSIIQNTSFTNSGASNTTGWDNGVNYHVLTTAASATANPRFTSNLLTGLTSDWYVQNWRIYIPTLNDGTQKYYMYAGFSEVIGAAQSRAVLFVYDLDGSMTGSAASANWQIMTANASTRTWVTTSTPVVAGQWINLRIIVNNTAAYFYVNGSLVGTNPITTNLPVTTSGLNVIYPMVSITKTSGTTARTLWVDYHTLDIKYATER